MRSMVLSTSRMARTASGVFGLPSAFQWWPMLATLKHSHGGLAQMTSGRPKAARMLSADTSATSATSAGLKLGLMSMV